jgi:hypothetical protein
MKVRKATRYIADCGKGFWSKKDCLNHEDTCRHWTNPKMKTCKTCRHGCRDKGYEDHGSMGLETWDYWECNNEKNTKDSHSGGPESVDYLSVGCAFYESATLEQSQNAIKPRGIITKKPQPDPTEP